MTLEELKALMEEALKASQAAAGDKALEQAAAVAKKAYDDAVAEAEKNKNQDGDGEEDPDESKMDDKTKAYLAKLRKENAGHRTKAKDLASKLQTSEQQKKAILKAAGIEEDSQTPEQKLEAASLQSQQLALRSAILESAVENGIGKDSLDYFEFLVAKAVGELKEGEELSDEAMSEIVTKVKKSGGTSANTTVGTGKGNPPPPDKKTGEITLEKFIRMSITEKSDLYTKNLDLYTSLVNEAKRQKKLV